MILDLLDKVSSVVGAVVALLTGLVAVLAWQRARAARRWWRVLQPLWRHQWADRTPHPYRLGLPAVPSLAEVFVPRRAVPRDGPAGAEADVADLLAGPGHVLLLGELGSGKSALVRQACTESARRWRAGRGRLRRTGAGPVVLSLPAGALVGRPLAEALAAAYATICPAVDFTRPPARGRSWLVCVDGVDAVTDPDDRSQVLHRLADAAGPRPGPPRWRLLVTSRQLAGHELALLEGTFQAHHLLLFTDEEVALLARRWFPAEPARQSFGDWLARQRITERARHPLTATIAALVWRNGWTGSVTGTGQAALLDGFLAALLDGGRTVLAAVTGQLRATPGGEPVAAWLVAHRTALVEVAAVAARDGGDPVPAVVDWVARHAPAPPVLPDWPGRVRALLLATGLFREPRPGEDAASGLLPAGRGLMDYLAAGPLADDWREDRWVAAMTTSADRGVGLSAYTRVATGPDFLPRMAARGPAGAISAGYVLATGQPVAEAARTEVLAALLAGWAATPDGPAAEAARECLSLLTTLAAVRPTRDLLRRIGADPHRPTVVRDAVALFFALRRQRAAAAGDQRQAGGSPPQRVGGVAQVDAPPGRVTGGRA
jgi:hypothetical protein